MSVVLSKTLASREKNLGKMSPGGGPGPSGLRVPAACLCGVLVFLGLFCFELTRGHPHDGPVLA
ncbi:MAG: hypothetical protein LBH73_09005, partial [Spirochaetaceae bacterium]|nr:hypothetical protein [Spirochaetaceae bacterium]